MPSLTSGYAQTVHMPVIDSSQDYQALKSPQIVTVSQVNHYALKIAVSDPAHHKLFAMAGSVVYFIPLEALPDPFLLYIKYPDLPPLLPGTGFLLCQLWPADFRKLKAVLPIGVPPPSAIVYLNVSPASVFTALEPVAQTLPDRSLTDNPDSGDHQQHVTELLDRVLLGKAGVFVRGGTHIGNMASSEFTLVFADFDDFTSLSPILHIRGMPDFAGNEWVDHPLIDAVSQLPVPVDIYLKFEVWNNQARAFTGLAGGVAVELMDRDTVSGDDQLLTSTTIAAGGSGEVHLSSPDLQSINEPEPDLYFSVQLGSHNPEPSLIADPWSSDVWVFPDSLPYHTGDGYYDSFAGTRLGSLIHPLRFHIGLGFWADLISHRPPVHVQQQLKAASRSVHFIEDPGGNPTPTEEGWSPLLNLDYYPIRVTDLPTINNQQLTPMQVLQHIRLEINTLVDRSLFMFELVDPNADGARWAATDPADPVALQQLLGIVLTIPFYGLGINVDNGSVVVSDIDTTHFTFSTIATPTDWAHPVSGNREIGFTPEPDGGWVFYTRGADRPTRRFDHDLSAVEFRGADVSWKSLQQGVARFVNDHGGTALVEPAFSARFPWDPVKALYWNPATARI